MSGDLVKILSKRNREFALDRGADARELYSTQVSTWHNIIMICVNKLQQFGNFADAMADLDRIFTLIERYKSEIFSMRQEDRENKILVTSVIPLIENDRDINFYAEKGIFYFVGAISHELIPAILSVIPETSADTNFIGLSSGIFIQMSSRYAAERSLINYAYIADLNQLHAKSKVLVEELNITLKTSKSRAANLEKQHESIIKELETEKATTIDEARDEIEKIKIDKANMIQDVKVESTQIVQAHVSAQKEFGKIQRPVTLWTQASKSHRNKFMFGTIALSLIFVTASGLTIWQLQNLLQHFGLSNANSTKDFSPATTVSVAILIAMLAAAGFIFKILGRFVTNSLTLAEDAAVRAALADTFIGFTAEDNKASEADRKDARTVMLAALFRPLPGHQQEDITAPTVLSLAQDLLKQKQAT